MSVCQHCGRETTNPKYCCRSCSAKQTNRLYPRRRQTPRYCQRCGELLASGNRRRKFCLSCNPQTVDWNKVTLADLTGKRRYQKHSRLRELARRTYIQSGQPLCCAVCGYDKHFEVCHLRAMNKFPDTTPVQNVNGLENLIALCPNHHWEFDHGLLSLPL